jgi:hypothetical protein
MAGNGSLFERLPRFPDSKLHPLFLIIRDSRSHIAARGLLDQVFSEYVDKDGNFVRDFQTQGFSARIWELSLFAYLFEEGYTLDSTHAMPDFIIPEGCAIEAVTNQPRDPMSASQVNFEDEEEYRAFITINRSAGVTEFQNQLRKAITSKMGKRFKDGLTYWELPHIRDLPFVLAVQCFYGASSTAFTDGLAASYLLGEQPGMAGLFDDSELAPLSAVLFSNSGTVAQFNRIGKQSGYGVDDVRIFRSGIYYDPTPGATEARQFGYEVGTPGAPPEDFAQSLHLIHNPHADHPLRQETLMGVRQTAWIQGKSESVVPGIDTFLPFASRTLAVEIGGQREARRDRT